MTKDRGGPTHARKKSGSIGGRKALFLYPSFHAPIVYVVDAAPTHQHLPYFRHWPAACPLFATEGAVSSAAWLVDAGGGRCCLQRKSHQYLSEGSVWHAQASGLVDKILRERADDIIDMDKAVRRVEAERHHQLPSAANEVCLVTYVPQSSEVFMDV